MNRKIAVVLFNLGGPDSLKAVRPFLFNLFNDQAIIGLPQPFRWLAATLISTLRRRTAQEIYAHMGGSSPLLGETEAQRRDLDAALTARFPDDEILVTIAMRYWRPFIAEAAGTVQRFNPDDVVLLPLYPQYSTTTTGSSFRAWREAYHGPGRVHAVCCYPEQGGLVAAHARKIEQALTAWGGSEPLRLIFSAHGLPEKIVAAGDPYPHQVQRTAAALARELGAQDWRVCYQSRVGPMAWIGPSTIETLQEAGRDKIGVVVVPIAFVSEHSETLVELDLDYRDLAIRAGVPVYLRAAAIGVEDRYIDALATMTAEALGDSGVFAGAISCREQFSKCPFQQMRSAA